MGFFDDLWVHGTSVFSTTFLFFLRNVYAYMSH